MINESWYKTIVGEDARFLDDDRLSLTTSPHQSDIVNAGLLPSASLHKARCPVRIQRQDCLAVSWRTSSSCELAPVPDRNPAQAQRL
jgi:hypothetical protein